jgi:hypothetical protein
MTQTNQPTQSHILAGHLSRRTSYRIIVDGPFGVREAAALIRLLQVQVEVLGEEAEPDQKGRMQAAEIARPDSQSDPVSEVQRQDVQDHSHD